MPRSRSATERAAGKLIAEIQKEWHERLGEPGASVSETAMNNAHHLLKAAKAGTLSELLQGRTVQEYLGTIWVRKHPSILPAIKALEATLEARHA